MGDLINFNYLGIVHPEERFKQLVNAGSLVQVDAHTPVLRYYRSGNELYKMAKIYLSEGNLENAYILLMRFLTIFVERIKRHPGYNEVPAETKKTITVKVKEIMPITEQLKAKLKQRYKKEYEEFLVEQENEKKQALEEEKRREKEAARNKTPAKIISPNVPSGFEPTAPVLNDIVYPNDFPSNEPQKSSGLLPGTKPSFDRTSKPLTKSLMEGGLRLIKIPDDTMIKFLEVARPNTLKNVETCGILAGQLKQHELLITHVILPKQSGSADSCITMHEEEIFDIQDSLNLITLGWIHTHPTQSAFLSSVDLHTQAGYQIMMPEAIAIVCSPKHNEQGFFSLTTNGLDFISKCTQQGFHPHPADQFMEASHFSLEKSSKIHITDLRQR